MATNPKDIFKILTVSRLEHLKKGQDLLLEAVARIKGQVTIDFIGEGTSLDYLKAKANKLKIENYVHFLGRRPKNTFPNIYQIMTFLYNHHVGKDSG